MSGSNAIATGATVCSVSGELGLILFRHDTQSKAFSGSKFSPVAIHHRRASTLSCFRAATFELVSCYSRLSGEIQNQRERRGKRQVSIVKATQNDSNYEREEQRWMREEQRWLREEQRWLRENARWTEVNQALQEEVRALNKELEELRAQRGYGGEITDVSLRNLVAGMRNLLQALAIPDSEDLPVLDSPEVLKQIAGTVNTTVVVGKSGPEVSPVSFVASPDKIIAVVTPERGRGNNPEAKSPTQTSPNSSKSANGATTTATKRTMKSGMEGDDVKELHDALSELGFYSGEEDIEFSVFSDGTISAVKTWQSSRGVPEDGQVPKELMAALLAEVAGNMSSNQDGAKSNSQPMAKTETTKPKQLSPEIKQPAPSDDLRTREIDRYERSDAQETGTGSSRRVYLLGENRWEEPGRVQKKQEEQRRIQNRQTTRTMVGAQMCFGCRGVGTMLCTDCEGTGELNVEEQFLEWLEEGEAKCPYCEGSGAIECDVCLGVTIKVEK